MRRDGGSVLPAHANTGDPNGPFEAGPLIRPHRADIHDGSEHNTLQSEAGYIDARPHVRQIDETLLQRTAGPYIRVKTGGYRTATAMAGSPQITDITWQTYLRCRRDHLAVMERRRLRRRKGG